MDQQWFNGAYCLILRELSTVIDANRKLNGQRRQAIAAAITKLVFLGMDVICSVYNFLSMERQVEKAHHTVETVQNCETELSDRTSGIVAATEAIRQTLGSGNP